MKLQNKKTGGLGNLIVDKDLLRVKTDAGWVDYTSISELNEEWEDYKEPEVYWFINSCGEVLRNIDASDYIEGEDNLCHKEIGNKFKTKEEGEKAVEKLKAWTRLKDKGFRFKGYYLGLGGNFYIEFETGLKYDTKDLDLLFSEEDD